MLLLSLLVNVGAIICKWGHAMTHQMYKHRDKQTELKSRVWLTILHYKHFNVWIQMTSSSQARRMKMILVVTANSNRSLQVIIKIVHKGDIYYSVSGFSCLWAGTRSSVKHRGWFRQEFLSFRFCIPFLIAVTKYPQNYFKKEDFVLNHRFLAHSIMAGSSLWWELEAAVHIGATVGQ